jgi:transglutaminase-like putative cysteine protease
MPGTYKLFTAIIALIGNIGLIATGEMGPFFTFIGTGLLWGYYRAMKGYPPLPKWAVGGLTLTTFLVFLINFYTTGDIFIAVAHMTLIFQTLKSFDIKEPWDPLQVFFVSLLQLLMASELTLSISFGIVFLVFLVFIVVSILLGHFVREGLKIFRPYRKPVAVITVLTLVLTVVFFVAIPRFRSGLWGKSFLKGIKTAGFSERVDFGSFGDVKLDETVVMRVIIKPDFSEPVYLRGMTFDYFDGISWHDTTRDSRRIYRTPGEFTRKVPEGAESFEAEIYLEPIDSGVIFTFKKPYRMESAGYYMRRDEAGSFYMRQKISKRFFYRMFSTEDTYYDNTYISSYLQFPDTFSSVRRLAEEVAVGAAGDYEKVNTLKDYLVSNFIYSLYTERPEGGASVVEHFLFESREGYCEHFATAMTLMARSIGIPARLVTGFLSVRKNEFGNYHLVRQSDAHSWVEAYIDGKWVLFDPTPPVESAKKSRLLLLLDTVNLNWNRYVVGFSAYDQRRMTGYFLGYKRALSEVPGLPQVRTMFAALALFMIIALFRSRFKKISSERYRDVSAEYIRFRRKVSRRGGRVDSSSTTGDVYREALRLGKFEPEAVRKFITSYRFLRFSGREEKGMLKDFLQTARELKK